MSFKTNLGICILLSICNTSSLSQIGFDNNFNFQKQPDPDYILPNQNISIQSYELELTPHLNGTEAFTFDATVKIKIVTLNNKVKSIKLHAKNLVFQSVVLVFSPTSQEAVSPIPSIDEKYDFWEIPFKRTLGTSTELTIIVVYKGLISNDMQGLYRSSYEDKGETKWLATTYFQPIHARKVFPCFDEPKYKAKFTLTIRRPKSFQPTLSNTMMNGIGKEDGDYYVEKFRETPSMSTYQLGFVVSEFDAAMKTNDNETDQRGIWARKDARNQGNYAFEIAQKSVEALETYLSYPLSKMNKYLTNYHVAVPDMIPTAMENWGIVTYRESNLMYVSDESSVRHKQQIAVGMTHELSHFWFGNLVTCDWWSELWLNEGFATFFHVFITDKVEEMDIESQFLTEQLRAVMVFDAYTDSPPLKNDIIYSPDEIASQFNPITYYKGAALVRMISDLLGPRTFQNALINYMNNTHFGSANEETLIKYFQTQADGDNSLSNYNNTNVLQFVSSWTSVNGFPLLKVIIDRKSKLISLEQIRFTKELEAAPPPITWNIPITYTTRSENKFNDLKPKLVLTSKFDTIIDERLTITDWVVFNLKQSAYYRVWYDDDSWKMIEITLNSRDRESIIPENRAQIIDDYFNFAREKMYNYNKLLDLLLFLENESHYAPWTAALAGFSYLRLLFQSVPLLQKSLDHHILSTMEKTLLPTIGFYESNLEKHIQKLFRMNILAFACSMEYKECVDESIDKFDKFKNKKDTIDPNKREYVYCTALRHGSAEDFEVLWSRYLTINVMNEKNIVLNALGCSVIREKIIKLLYNSITQNSPIRKEDKMTVFNSVIMGGTTNVDIAFEFVQENLKTIRLVYGNENMKEIFQNMALRMSRDQVVEFEDMIRDKTDYLTEQEIEWGNNAVRNAKNNMNKAENLQEEFMLWFKAKYNSAGILNISWLLIFSMLAYNLCSYQKYTHI